MPPKYSNPDYQVCAGCSHISWNLGVNIQAERRFGRVQIMKWDLQGFFFCKGGSSPYLTTSRKISLKIQGALGHPPFPSNKYLTFFAPPKHLEDRIEAFPFPSSNKQISRRGRSYAFGALLFMNKICKAVLECTKMYKH